MRIYHPVRGVGGALRENSFAIIDDAGVEIGQGGLEYRVLKKMLPDRPLDIEMSMNAHPMASDTLYGALCARAESIKDEQGGLPARLYTRCAIDDSERHEYFTRMGFDDYDGDELFVLHVPQDMSTRRRNYSPVGTKSIDVDLRTRTRREEFLLGLKEFGYVEHASEWLEERMKDPVFIARSMYLRQRLCRRYAGHRYAERGYFGDDLRRAEMARPRRRQRDDRRGAHAAVLPARAVSPCARRAPQQERDAAVQAQRL